MSYPMNFAFMHLKAAYILCRKHCHRNLKIRNLQCGNRPIH